MSSTGGGVFRGGFGGSTSPEFILFINEFSIFKNKNKAKLNVF